MYNNVGKQFASHGRVNHYYKEYVRGNVHTNTIEGFFSVFKRGLLIKVCGYRHDSLLTIASEISVKTVAVRPRL